jgi:RNA polymerase sigma-70 factor (ECF subfamily)
MIPTAVPGPVWLDPGVWKLIRWRSHALVGAYGFTLADREDIQQELVLEVHRRMSRFDPSRSGRQTFIRRVANNRIANLIAEQRASCRDYRRCQHSLDEPVGQDRFDQLGETISADEYESRTGRASISWREHSELRADVEKAISLLPVELAAIAILLRSVSVIETARLLNVPRATLYRRLADIRRAFESAGLDLYLGRPSTALVRRRHGSTAVVEAVAQGASGRVLRYGPKSTDGRPPR